MKFVGSKVIGFQKICLGFSSLAGSERKNKLLIERCYVVAQELWTGEEQYEVERSLSLGNLELLFVNPIEKPTIGRR
jgi:hypothetical protein